MKNLNKQIVVRTNEKSNFNLEIALSFGCTIVACNNVGNELEYILDVSEAYKQYIFNLNVLSEYDGKRKYNTDFYQEKEFKKYI